ncbi:MAG: transglutaminase domain-containing protein [Deltaproteobacteria bacterium]|nr:transglutaminase domain-containing protein [Deltaproteobacteria bacterium]
MIKILAAILFLSTMFLPIGCSVTNKKQGLSAGDETIKTVVDRLIAGAETDEQKIEKIFYFVRDEIKFGWVYPQEIPAEEVLRNSKGVCMQKTNLLVAMAREAGLKARFHFMYVHKNALEDFLPEYAYDKWVDPFPHTFPEVFLNGKWISMEPTIDRELHDICIKKKINFGRYENIVKKVSIEFSADGVKGHQQYWHAEGKDSFYGDDLSKFSEYLHKNIPWYKRMMQPLIFIQADKIMDRMRKDQCPDA